jgi:hypothetical protein
MCSNYSWSQLLSLSGHFGALIYELHKPVRCFLFLNHFFRSSLMRHTLSIAVLGFALVSGMAFAADPVKPAAAATAAAPVAAAPAAAAPAAEKTAQQSKMATCNKEAEGKKGDERKAFMKDCLSANKQEKQQNKMKTCNADAAGKKGDERKAFMSECLKK